MAARKSTSQPTKPAEPVADLGARQVMYWFPSITMPDGTVVHCEHRRYGHESEAAAKRCLRALSWQQQRQAAEAVQSAPKPAAKVRSGSQGQTKVA